ncbi:hypothetical protein S40293_02878 [Stachybotrys chartarum IBT 40293]|nr:hypothetical protein S40293_02878 [Stachybotrys chartarum IBT 40293]
MYRSSPLASNASSSLKRKRLLSTSDTQPTRAAINPFSYPPAKLAQLPLAGLSDHDEDPASSIPNFPHRGYSRSEKSLASDAEPTSDDEGEETEQSSASTRKKKLHSSDALYDELQGTVGVLLRSVHQFLDRGDIVRAARAYGLILQQRHNNIPTDVRKHRLWAIGAEILMRHGETPQQSADDNEAKAPPKRWGSAANMGRVKAYYETLIQQHPYDYHRPHAVSAVHFHFALLSCEIYNTHAEQVLALDRLHAHDVFDQEEEEDDDFPDQYEDDGEGRQQARLRAKEDRLRLQALETMRDIADRMDSLMQELPYSKNNDYLRLRAMAALYVADLVVPSNASISDTLEAEGRRKTEQQAARNALQKIIRNGAELDDAAQSILDSLSGQGGHQEAAFRSSLPIRRI